MEIDRVTAIIEDVGHTEVLSRFGVLGTGDIREKSRGDPVTVADVAAEDQLARRLRGLLPGSVVVGEESAHADRRLLAALCGSDPVWVIDPIDGTANYARGLPVFAMMVALVIEGRTQAGWIHDPYHTRTAVAELGGGAYLSGSPMTVAPDRATRSTDVTGAIYAGRFSSPELASHVHARKHDLRSIGTIACAGWEYLRLAGGGTHFAFFTRTMPWDHLPGILIHAEAGGLTRRIDGADYRAGEPDGPALLIAAGEHTWNTVHSVLIGGSPTPG